MKIRKLLTPLVLLFCLWIVIVQGVVPRIAGGGEQAEPKRAMLNRHETELRAMKWKISSLEKKTKSLNTVSILKRLKNLEHRIGLLERSLKNVKAKIKEQETGPESSLKNVKAKIKK